MASAGGGRSGQIDFASCHDLRGLLTLICFKVNCSILRVSFPPSFNEFVFSSLVI